MPIHPPPAATEVARSVREYAEAALTTDAFAEHTSITLEDDPVQVSHTHTHSPCLPDPSARPLPTCHPYKGIISRLSRPLRHRPPLDSITNGGPDDGSSGPCHKAPARPPSPRTAMNIVIPGFHGRTLNDSRAASIRIVSTSPCTTAPRCKNPPFIHTCGASHTRLGGVSPSAHLSRPVRTHASTERHHSTNANKCLPPPRQPRPAPTCPSSHALRTVLVCSKRTPTRTLQQSQTFTETTRARLSLTALRLPSSPQTLSNTTPTAAGKALWRSKTA